jgi:hypothetical protein
VTGRATRPLTAHREPIMPDYRVIAIATEIADAARDTGRSPRYGHPTHVEVATGYGPCRHCLRHFRVGEERRVLFTYDPFTGTESLPLPGPVFVHAERCARYAEDAGFPRELSAHPLTLTGYGRGRLLRADAYAVGDEVVPALERLLARDDVDYVHVRDTSAGCFDLAVVRA